MADFVTALADWMATTAAPPLRRTQAPYELFAHAAIEQDGPPKNYADYYSTLRAFPGRAMGTDPLRHVNLQVYTLGENVGPCMALAQRLHTTLLHKPEADDDELTVRHEIALAGFAVQGLMNLTEPSVLGRERDGKQRVEVVFNFECSYRAVPAQN